MKESIEEPSAKVGNNLHVCDHNIMALSFSLFFLLDLSFLVSITQINVLLQAYISQLKLEGFALMADMVYVTQVNKYIFYAFIFLTHCTYEKTMISVTTNTHL